jgi:hypothetical protein
MCEGKGGDESGQTHLLTFGKILDRRRREWGLGSLIEIVVLDDWSCSIWSCRTPIMGYQPRPGHDKPHRAVSLIS